MDSPADMALSEEKRALRAEMRERRRGVGAPERTALEAALTHQVLEIVDGDQLGRRERLTSMSLYAAKDDEASVTALEQLRSLGAHISYPRTGPTGITFHRVASPAALERGQFGVDEPPTSAPIVLDGALRLIVAPGLAFDSRGNRLGWGGGFYDAAFLRHPLALRIGVAFTVQLVESVPTDASDISVDYIITEEGVTRCNRST